MTDEQFAQFLAEQKAAIEALSVEPKPSRRSEFLLCLRAAAAARIENEPGLLLTAADALLAGVDKRFP